MRVSKNKLLSILVLILFAMISIACVSAENVDNTINSDNYNSVISNSSVLNNTVINNDLNGSNGDLSFDDNLFSFTVKPSIITQIQNENNNLYLNNNENTINEDLANEVYTSLISNDLLDEVYVDSKNGHDYNRGSKDSPFATFAHALESVKDNGKIIFIGEYIIETDLSITDKSVTLAGINGTLNGNKDNYGILTIAYGFSTLGYDLTVTITNLTLKNGYKFYNGGAISVGSHTSLIIGDNVTFVDNHVDAYGGAIYSLGSVIIRGTNVTFEGNSARNGGAIYVDDGGDDLNRVLTINGNNITFEGNSARNGGAIYGVSPTKITISGTNVTFEGNSAEEGGGAIYDGGASYGDSKTKITIGGTNVTFEGNSARDGVICSESSVSISGTNIAFKGDNAHSNSGAIYAKDKSEITIGGTNVTFEGNSGSTGAIYSAMGSKININSPINFTDNEGYDIYVNGTLNINSDCYSNNPNSIYKAEGTINSKVIVTVYNGELINASYNDIFNITAVAKACNLTVCGLNMNLTVNGVDKGAFSYANGIYDKSYKVNYVNLVPVSAIMISPGINNYIINNATFNITVPTEVYVSKDGNDSTGDGSYEKPFASLEPALYVVANNGKIILIGDIIVFNQAINKNVTLAGIENGTLKTDHNRFLNISSGVTVTITNLTLKEGYAIFYGGAIYSEGTLIIGDNVNFVGNHNGDQGGAIYNNYGSVIISGTNITFKDNDVSLSGGTASGGAIYNNHGSVIINGTNISFINNKADEYWDNEQGGAIYSKYGSVIISGVNVSFSGNTARNGGGAIYSIDSNIIINSSVEFINNNNYDIYVKSTSLNITGDCYSNNPTSIYKDESSSIVSDVTVTVTVNNDDLIYVEYGDIVNITATVKTGNLTIGSLSMNLTVGGVDKGSFSYDENSYVKSYKVDCDGVVPVSVIITSSGINNYTVFNATLNVISRLDEVYVSKEGSDITGTGSRDNPFKTLAYALEFIKNNGKIIFIGENIVLDQAIGKNVTLTGIDNGVLSGNNTNGILNISGGVTVTISNLTFKDGNGVSGAIFIGSDSVVVINDLVNFVDNEGFDIYLDSGKLNIACDCSSNNPTSIYKAAGASIVSDVTVTVSNGEVIDVKYGDVVNITAVAKTGNLTIEGLNMNLTVNDADKGAFNYSNDSYVNSYKVDYLGVVPVSVNVTDSGISSYTVINATLNVSSRPDEVYVSKNGNDSNDGSQANPFATLEKALEVVKTNGKIIFIGENIVLDQAIGKNVTLTGIDNGVLSGNCTNGILNISGGVTVTISNLTFKDGNGVYGAIFIGSDSVVVINDLVNFVDNEGFDIYLSSGKLNIACDCSSDNPTSIYKAAGASIVSDVTVTVNNGNVINGDFGDIINITAVAKTGNLTIEGLSMNLTVNGTDKGAFNYSNDSYVNSYKVDYLGVVPVSVNVTDSGISNYTVINASLNVDKFAEVYVASYGNDSGIGSQDSPFATFAHALDVVKNNGKIIFIGDNIVSNQLIVKNITLTGINNGTLKPNGEDNILTIYRSDVTVTITNLTLKDSKSYQGGAIYSNGYLIIGDNVRFVNNHANALGGAICITKSLIINGTNITFDSNDAKVTGATSAGGAIAGVPIYNTVNIIITGTNICFVNNYAENGFGDERGGAIDINKGMITISGENISFINNHANKGGAIHSTESTVIITGPLEFINNTNYDIYVEGNSLNITSDCYSNNPTSIYKADGASIVSNVTVTVNNGKVIYADFGDIINITAVAKTANLTIEGLNMNLTVNGTDKGAFIYDKNNYVKSYKVDVHSIVPISVNVTDSGISNYTVINASLNVDKFAEVYVSKEGNDSNVGSKDSPLKTFAHALEIVESNGKIIFIGENIISDQAISKNVTLVGIENGVLNGNGVLNITGGATVTISNLTFKDGNGDYGAIYIASGSMIVIGSNTLFVNNSARYGAIYADSDSVITINSPVSFVDSEGYDIYLNKSSSLNIIGDCSSDNPTSIYKAAGATIVSDVTVTVNSEVINAEYGDIVNITAVAKTGNLTIEGLSMNLTVNGVNKGAFSYDNDSYVKSYSVDVYGIVPVSAIITSSGITNYNVFNDTLKVTKLEVYVSKDGNDSNGVGSKDKPFKTFAYALEIVKTNGKIIFIGDNIVSDQLIGKNVTLSGIENGTLNGNKISGILNIANGVTVVIGNLTFKDGKGNYGAIYAGSGSVVALNSPVEFIDNKGYDIYLDGSTLTVTCDCYSNNPKSIYKAENATIISKVTVIVNNGEEINVKNNDSVNITAIAKTGNLTIYGLSMNLTVNGVDKGAFDNNNGTYVILYKVDYMGTVPVSAIVNSNGINNCTVINATLNIISRLDEIYVANYGSDITGDGSKDNPFETFDHALDILNPNGKIIFIGENIVLNQVISKNVTLAGIENGTLSGNKTNRILNIASGVTVTITNLTLKDGYAKDGGAIYSKGNLIISDNVSFISNKGNYNSYYGDGGAIYGNVTINGTDVSFRDNSAYNGGAIRGDSVTVNGINISFVKNGVENDGGAIYGNVTINGTDVSFRNNSAKYHGGAIRGDSVTVNGTNITFEGHSSYYGGAAIYVRSFSSADTGGSVIISGVNVSFVRNYADNYGSAIYTYGGNVTINGTDVSFVGNRLSEYGVSNNDATIRGYSVTINSSVKFIDNEGFDIRSRGSVNITSNCSSNSNKSIYYDNSVSIISDVIITVLNNETIQTFKGNTLKITATVKTGNLTIANLPISLVVNGTKLNNFNYEKGSYYIDYNVDFLGRVSLSAFTNASGVTSYKVLNATLDSLKTVNMYVNIPGNLTHGIKSIIIVNFSDNVTGNVTLIIDEGTPEIAVVNNGSANFELPEDLSAGNHTLYFIYSGDAYYLGTSQIVNVTVNRALSTISVPSIYVGDKVTIVLSSDAAGNVTVIYDDTGYNATVGSDGRAVVNIPNLAEGNYTLTVKYSGDNNYLNCTWDNVNLTVKKKIIPPKKTPVMIIDAPVIVTGEDALITVNLPADATGNVVISLNGESYTVKLVNGACNLTVSGLAPGSYNVNAVYSGDSRYYGVSGNATLVVKGTDIVLSGSDVEKYYGGNESYVVRLTKDGEPLAGEVITIVLNGVSYNRTTDNDGLASLSINLGVGVYNVSASYANYVVNNTVTVKSTVDAYDLVKYYLNGTQYEAYVLDSRGNPLDNVTITFNIHGVFYHKEAHNGKVLLNINLLPGEYIITAYNDVTGEASSNNVKVLPTIESSNLVKYYRNDSQFIVRLLNGDGSSVGAGETVTFNINGVFYTRTTDNEGYAPLNINLNPGDYIITTSYGSCFVGNNITVLPVLTGSDLNMTYLDGSKYECKLVDGHGTPVKGAEVTFNIHGVFYHKITDDDGIARLNINLLPGEYIITAIYNGTMTSNKITVRDSII